jgi:hypothetical protein
MTRVSVHYNLRRGQESLEFVDVDVSGDTMLFIDPGSIRLLDTSMSHACASLLQSFFGHVLQCVHRGNDSEARDLLASLNEPNETRLGLSRGRSAGHGMGEGLAELFWGALSRSQAAQSGLLQDLEDVALFVDQIDRDIISDVVTNIIRDPLIDFTITMAGKYDIPTVEGITMSVWDRRNACWMERVVPLPMADDRPLLLVPRAFVRRRRGTYSAGKYYDHYVLPFLQQQHFSAGSSLVRILRDGTRRPPYKKTLRKINPDVKPTNVTVTLENGGLLESYRDDAVRQFETIDHEDLAKATNRELDWDKLLQGVLAVPAGKKHATDYHKAVECLLTAVLYPALDFPLNERELHEGRKRVDIWYTNIARHGFFYWVHAVHATACPFVVVECKNYSSAIKNPELDQLTGRFGVQRGFLGIMCYRGRDDKASVTARCKDAAKDGRGYVIALDDEDLKALVQERKESEDGQGFGLLHERFQELL